MAWAHSATVALLCVALSACGLSQVGGDLADAAAAPDADVAADAAADATPDAAETTVDAADAATDAGLDSAATDAIAPVDTDAADDADATPDVGCTNASACDDGKACTTDTCDAGGACVHLPWSATACEDGDPCTVDLCDDATGCVHALQPASACDDGDVCTDDTCGASTGCVHGAVSCNDTNACTQDVCTSGFGCSHVLVPADNCADGNACTVDACDPALGCTHTAVDCKDTDACTVDNCTAATGCVHIAVDATACSDNDACTIDVCVSPTGCVSAPLAATACDDDNTCTQDACDASQGCTHVPLDATPCDDGDDCTSLDACANGTCKGEVTHWFKPTALPGGNGQWVGIAPRKDGTRLLIGWQTVAGAPPQRQMILQRINGSGEPQGPLQVEPSLNDLVIDHVATNGTDVLVHGFRVESPGVTHPWYGLLDDSDQLFQSGTYDPPTSDATGGMPRTAFGLTIVPPGGGASFTRWFTSVDSATIGNTTRHAFYSIEAGSKPAWHSLGEGNEGCVAVLIRDGVLVGTCDVKDSADYFRATFSATGKVLSTQRTSPPVPLAFTAVTASLRADGHVWYVGHASDAYAPTLLIGVDAKGKLLKIASPVGGTQGAVFGAIQETDGSSWLFGTTGQDAAMWRLDDDATLIGMRTYGPGAWLHAMRDDSGLWLAGASSALTAPWPSASTGGIVARTDLWGAETCSNGAPCASASACSDGKPCTNDWCDVTGCMHTSRTLCEDGDPCTGGDKCASGACVAGATIACQDNNPCTLDACDATGCTFTPTAENTNCDDGNSCTTITHCIAGACSIAATQVVGVGCGNGNLCIADGRCVQPWAADVVAGGQHTCAVRPDGRIFCWGDNAFHALGDSDVAGSFIPLEVPGSSNWAPSSVVLGAGNGFNVAWIDGYGSALGWGRSNAFQADVALASTFTMTATPQTVASGLGAFASISLGANHGCSLDKAGAVSCWGKSDFGQVSGVNSAGMSAVAITGLGVVQAIGVGGDNSCAVQADGTVQCWGAMAGAWHTGNSAAGGSTAPLTVLGLGTVATLAIGAQHGCGIVSNGTVRCWGANDVGQLGNGTVGIPAFAGATSAGSSKAAQLAAGDAFTCMLATDGEVACWGDGSLGQMGNGGNTGNASPLVVPDLTGTVQITARGSHACARRFDGAVFCWGTGGIPGMPASTVPVPVPDSLP